MSIDPRSRERTRLGGIAVAHSGEIFSLRCWFQRSVLTTHFLEPGVAAFVERANILEIDVWKAHSVHVRIGVDSVSTLRGPGGLSGTFLSDRGDILLGFPLARRQRFM